MTTAVELYRALTIELDKYESPTFSVNDFNYFWNTSQHEYIHSNYNMFDIKQKELDDLRVLLNVAPITITDNTAPLPADYLHLLDVRLVLSKIDPRCEVPEEATKSLKKLEADKVGYITNNSYLRPSFEQPYYTIRGNNLIFYTGDSTIISGELEYLSNFTEVFLDPDRGTANDVNPNFDAYINREILNVCVRKVLENIESPRYQSNLNETQLRAE